MHRSRKILIYFHGNAEDLGGATQMLKRLSNSLRWHVIAPEYPGYGICFRERKSSKEIIQRAKRLYEFLTVEFGYKEKDIILFGRSLGSGPSVQLAAHTNPAWVILMSAYSSIKNVARDICCWARCLIKERFNSLIRIKDIKCPIFIIHGALDTVIRPSHSEALYAESQKHDKDWECTIRAQMDHNRFSMKIDIADPIRLFMAAREIDWEPSKNMNPKLQFCEIEKHKEIAVTPDEYETEFLNEALLAKSSKWWCTIF